MRVTAVTSPPTDAPGDNTSTAARTPSVWRLHLLTAGCLTWIIAGALLVPRTGLDILLTRAESFTPSDEELAALYLLLLYGCIWMPLAMAAIALLIDLCIPGYLRALRGHDWTTPADSTTTETTPSQATGSGQPPMRATYTGPLY